ncbi:DhaKLM operon coactivator DhaQ [Isobaculum melis]|uniref:DhaKLM operon coactivator DhaQ n=1 Tax=Isobaculum melis TaxID=142588 RepID=A0A1H9UEW2_9LACT|nr:DhaKLM operon coactivator DhaQ [Isobaculum melis]SES07889.1 dihydroxyacetone kinase [Isobaculum melis]
MKKIMNHPAQIVSQMLSGLLYANEERLAGIQDTGVVYRKKNSPGKVAIVSGGGSGHEPAHTGFVGEGMLAACICGPIFVPPTPEEILQGIQIADQGAGVFLVIKNFEKDVSNFLAAKEQALEAGYQVEHVIVNDDCSIEEHTFKKRRRGVAGTVFVQKILAAAAEAGYSLSKLKELGQKVVMATNTLGVALSPSVVPGENTLRFQLAENEISFGIGIHGEPGYRTEPLHSSERLAIELVNKLKSQFNWQKGDQFAMMVNGLGGTPLMELFVFSNDVRRLLALEGINISFKKVGNFMTSNDMAGLSLTFLKIAEPEWLDWLKAPADTYAW